MLTRLIVYLAYFLKTSVRYRNTKLFFYDLLENPHSRLRSWFDLFMVTLVLLSVFMLIKEADHTRLGGNHLLFERAIVTLFIIEYLLRGWLYNDIHKIILEHYETAHYLNAKFRLGKVIRIILAKKLAYISSPLAIIDLLAILPTYRELRMLRIFLIFRLFKLFRYINSINLFTDVLANKRFELYTLAVFLGFLIFTGSTALYLFENPNHGGKVNNLFEAMYLSIVTLATVGYGDISPHTVNGRLVAIALMFSGLIFIAFFTSIIVSAFNEKLHDMRENRVYAELNRFKHFVIICGFGRVGQHIARQLEKNKQPFVIIDIAEARVIEAKNQGYQAIHANPTNNGVLIKAGINHGATAVLCTTSDDVVNVYITLTSRHLNPDIRIISRANGQENVKKLYQAGASNVIQPFEIAAMAVAEYIGQPVAFEAIFGILRQEKQFILETIEVLAGSFIVDKNIVEINFERSKLMLIGVISANPLHVKHPNRYEVKNQHFYFNPAQHFVLQAGDLLVLLGREVSLIYFRDQVRQSCLKNKGNV